MYFVDILIVLMCITALLRGFDRGVVRQTFATIGLVIGFLSGAFIQGSVMHTLDSPLQKALVALGVITVAVIICSAVGEYIGNRLKAKIERLRLRHINTTDKVMGSVLSGTTLLLVVWIGAAIFSSMPVDLVQKQLKNSSIIAGLNSTLPSVPSVASRISHLIDPNAFPHVFTGLEPRIDNTAPLPSIGSLDTAVQKARSSVVRVEGEGCGGITTGSGFVAADGIVITNAHVVAGVTRPEVVDGNGRHRTKVIGFDESLDVAILRTTGLAGEPLPIASGQRASGSPAAVLGFPGGGPFTASPATILDAFIAKGRDIYDRHTTERHVYSVKAAIEPGNSGGPLVDADGIVVGLVFAESTTYEDVGYALLMDKISESLIIAQDRNQTVGTGTCAS